MVNIRNFALVFGLVFLAAGIAGFIPALVVGTPEGHGLLLGLFPVNWIHNVIHIVFGVWGLAAFFGATAALAYARSVAVIYAVLAVAGLIPGLNTVWGYIPIHGHDVWLHALLAVVAGYFGFLHGRTIDTGHPVPTR